MAVTWAVLGLCSNSNIEEDGLARTLHMYVEAVDDTAWCSLACRDQRIAPVCGNGGKKRVLGVGRGFVREIETRVGVQEQAAHQNDDVDVRRLLAVDRARLHGLEHEAVFGIGAGASPAESLEAGIGTARISRVGIAALRIRLPDLDQGVADRLTL